MSNYSSMRGSYTLTQSDIRKVHTNLRRRWNAHYENLYAQLIAIYDKLGGTKGVTKLLKVKGSCSWQTGLEEQKIDRVFKDALIKSKGKKPLKKDFVKAKTSSDRYFFDEYGNEVIFDGCAIRVDVDENNHAVEHFEEGFLWNALVSELKSLKWSRKDTGGYLNYIDEYMRDGDEYSTQKVHFFGKIGDKNKGWGD